MNFKSQRWRVALHTASLVSLVLGALGCSPARAISKVRDHHFGDRGESLGDAYSQLLDNVAWSKTRQERERYITVSGLIKGTQQQLVVYYSYGSEPPVVAFFELDGRRRAAKEFANFLSAEVLQQQLRQPEREGT